MHSLSPARREDSPGAAAGVLWLLAAGLLVCFLYLGTEAFLLSLDFGFPLDDSWIHLQFARNLADGEGLSYNPGEAVTGSTAPLWTALLSLLFFLPGSVVMWTKALGIALHLTVLAATHRLARDLGLGSGPAALATGLTLASSWLAWSAISGMEIPLFILLSLGGMILHLAERRTPSRPPLSLAVFGLSILARPEGALLLVLAVIDRLLSFERVDDALRLKRPAPRKILVGLLLAACALIGPLVLYAWIGGTVLPTTFGAKTGELQRLLPSTQYVYVILGIFFRSQPFMVLLAGAGVLNLVERLGTPRDRGLLPALWLIGLPLAYSLLSPLGQGLIAGNFGRYYFPLFPVLIVVGTLGLERASRALGPRFRVGPLALPLRAALVLLLLWPTVSDLAVGAQGYARNVANVQDSDVRLARWLGDRLPPEAVLAVNDIGAFKFFLPNRVVDLAGIVTPEIQRFINEEMSRGATWEQAMLVFVERRRPDYLAVFPSWFPGLARSGRFPVVLTLPIPNNRTMGGDEIVLYSTPWTRYPLLGVSDPPGEISGGSMKAERR